ncbi:MAG: helix-turn-helix transcriptional regulator [Sulfurimonas sp.]|jgi:transcriptional regulator with XRE-family HTH domain|uniref:helix-turn-helix domain-containing protein n=1 Tax=Sulfurimonas sp. TaxID=2022749 RepID=UPI00356AB152
MKDTFIKNIAQFGDRFIIAGYEHGIDSHAFCITDHQGTWAVIARGGVILTRKDPAPAKQPKYITRMWQEYDKFMKDIPETPEAYQELIQFKQEHPVPDSNIEDDPPFFNRYNFIFCMEKLNEGIESFYSIAKYVSHYGDIRRHTDVSYIIDYKGSWALMERGGKITPLSVLLLPGIYTHLYKIKKLAQRDPNLQTFKWVMEELPSSPSDLGILVLFKQWIEQRNFDWNSFQNWWLDSITGTDRPIDSRSVFVMPSTMDAVNSKEIYTSLKDQDHCYNKTKQINFFKSSTERIEDYHTIRPEFGTTEQLWKAYEESTRISPGKPKSEIRYINSLPGRRITEARKALKISQQTLSEKTGITQSKLSRIESGLSDLECTELTVISGQLQKPESYFFEEYRVENEETVWVKDDTFNHYKPFCVIGMSPWSDKYRTIFAAPVTYERNLVIEEDSREQEISYPRHDYDRIIAVPWSNLVRTADGKGYILKDEPVKKDYAE